MNGADEKNVPGERPQIAEIAKLVLGVTGVAILAGCQDLIVTKTGKKEDPMLGWMTNVDIGRLSKA